jgi:hypothetical protein
MRNKIKSVIDGATVNNKWTRDNSDAVRTRIEKEEKKRKIIYSGVLVFVLSLIAFALMQFTRAAH